MKRMLINATQEEELRMAMVDGQRLFDLNIEGPASERKKANIYKGKITRIEPSLEAAFIDYGSERHGFLPLKEISSEYFLKDVESGKKPNIREVLKEGQDIVVQIDKEERGNKGAALTTFVSLAGRFIVLKPNKARSGGVSRRIVGEDRDNARDALSEIEIPKGMSVILRTAGIGRSAEELAWDLENLLQIWQAILDHVLRKPAPFLLYRESNAVIRALRDYLTNEIGEILIDNEETYSEALEFVEQVMPHNAKKLKLYTDTVPLFTRFQIESQIESAFAHSVTLPSGGSIVIDHTEALVSIDINSARATKGGDIEATALNTNLEAADEIARQLRIRDLGGLIVVDFIDMGPQKNQREVENRLREAVRQDRARVQIGKISRFGLLEMSRQRLRPSIGESAYQTCPRCSGFGTIRSIESLALAILRLIGEEARKERTAKVIAQLPVEVATYLLNEKRDWVQSLESSHDTQVVLVANAALETPHYDVRRVRDDQVNLPENAGASYALAEAEAEPTVPTSIAERKIAEQAAIEVIKPTKPIPQQPEPEPEAKPGGLWNWLKGLFGVADEETSEEKPRKRDTRRGRSTAREGRGRGKPGSSSRGKSRQQGDKRAHPKKKKPKKKSADHGQASGKAGSGDAKGDKPSKDDGGGDRKRGSRGRRSRGGRRRRRSADGAQQKDGDTAGGRSNDTGRSNEDRKLPVKTAGDDQPKPKKKKKKKKKKAASDTTKAASGSGPEPGEPKAAQDAGPGPDERKAKAREDAEAAAPAQADNAGGDGRGKAARKESAPKDKPPEKTDARPAERVETAAGSERRASGSDAASRDAGKPGGNGGASDAGEPPAKQARPTVDESGKGRLLPWDAPAPAPEQSHDKSDGDSAERG